MLTNATRLQVPARDERERVRLVARVPAPASAEHWVNFGADAQRLADALRAERLTILVSAAGVGKTTLLVDGLLPLLRQRPAEAIYFVDLWSHSQLDSLQRELGDEPTGEQVRLGQAEAMSAPRLSAISQRHGGARLLFVLDHFDWLLAGAEHDPALQRFVDGWATALHAPDLDAHFLIAVDEGAWHRMGALRARIAQVTQEAFALLARPGGRLLEPLVLDRHAEDAQAPEVSDADFLASFNESLKRVAKPARHGPRLEDFANSLNTIASQASTAARAAAAAEAQHVAGALQRVDVERASLVASQQAEARRTAAAVEAARQADAERATIASAREAEQRAAAERLAEAQKLKQALASAEAAAQAAQVEQRAQAERHAEVEATRIAEANRLAQALASAEAAAQAALVKQRAEAERHAEAEAARVAEANRLAQALATALAAAQAALVKQRAEAERHAEAKAARVAEANRLAQALACTEAAALREAQARHAAEASARRASEAQPLARAALASAAPARPLPVPPSTPAAPVATAMATRMLVPAAATTRPARRSPPWGAALLAVAAVLVLWWWWSTRPTRQAQQPTVAAAVTAAPAAAPPLRASSISAPASEPAVERERYAMLIPTAADSHGAIERELAAALSAQPAAMQLVPVANGSGLISGLQAPGRLAIAHFDALRAVHGNAAAPLRVLTPLFPVEVLFIVRADSPIKHLHELRGQRINIGPAQGDGSQTVREMYRRLTGTEVAEPTQYDNDQALAELVGFGSIDAMVIIEPLPSAWWDALAPGTARRLRVLKLDLRYEADRRLLNAPGTSQSRAGATAIKEKATTTPAVMSYLVTSGEGDADSEQLTAMAQALCRELPRLREQGHPKWRELQPGAQLDTGWPVVRAFQSVLSRCARR